MVIKENPAPFGVATKRFANIGYHPNLDPTGSMRKVGGLGPGQYDVHYADCWYKMHSSKDSWTRKKETEEFSQMLGYRRPEILHHRQETLKANGPGSLEISESLFKNQSHNVKENVFFGKQNRFSVTIKNNVPPPGSYGKNHDPYVRLEETKKPLHQWTHVPLFEWDNFVNRFKLGRPKDTKTLPPNIYKIKFGIDQTLIKKVSKRGPYDCSTGPRDSSTIKGYFAPKKFCGPKNWPMSLPSEIDKLKHQKKKHYGKFLQCNRFTRNPGTRNMLTDLVMCPKNPDEPGPGHYNLDRGQTIKKNLYPFNKSVIHARPVKVWEISPGIGRYNPALPKCKYKKNESWMFKSNSKREFYTIITYNNF